MEVVDKPARDSVRPPVKMPWEAGVGIVVGTLAGVLFLAGGVFLARAVDPSCHDRYGPQLRQMRSQADPLFASQALHINAKVDCVRFVGPHLAYTLRSTAKPQLTETFRRAGWRPRDHAGTARMTSPDGSVRAYYGVHSGDRDSRAVSVVAIEYAGSGSHLVRNLLIGMTVLLAVMLLPWAWARGARSRSRRRSAATWGAS